MKKILTELGIEVSAETLILCDNQGAIELAKNPGHHSRSKHIDIRHHFIREAVGNKIVAMKYINTNIMAADILTKPLARNRHHELLKRLGIQV